VWVPETHPHGSCDKSVLMDQPAEDFGSVGSGDVEIGIADWLAGHGAR